jgi:hypothetical protein
MKLGRAPAERSHAPGGWVVAALAAFAPACAATPAPTPDFAAVGASSAALHPVVEFEFESLDERPVSSTAARGKPTVLAFVTTGSLMAQAQVDFLVAMAKHDGEELNYALVALEEPRNRELVQLYKKTLAVPFPVAMADAPTLGGAGSFGDVTAVPVTVVLDRAGRVILRAAGRVVKSQELRAALRGL